jgi:hypothetical protein
MRSFRIILAIQTIYYCTTALWALVDIQSFIMITGPKTDIWLVKTVTVLLLAVTLCFITQLMSPGPGSWAVMVLAMCCCLSLAGIDIYYSLKDVIQPVYLIDSIVQLFLLVCWVIIYIINIKRPSGNNRSY